MSNNVSNGKPKIVSPFDLNVSLRASTEGFNKPYTQFQTCMKVGDVYVYPEAKDDVPVNYSKLSKDYSASIEEVLTKPGYHTWSVFEDGSFRAAAIFSPYETLSKHGDLYRESGNQKVIAAGECKIGPNKEVTYNFLSGTFMVSVGDAYERKYSGKYEPVYESWMTNEWTTRGATRVDFRDSEQKTLFSNIELTDSVLQELQDAGIPVYQFPSYSKCMEYKEKWLIESKKQSARTQYEHMLSKGYMKKKNGQVMTFEEWLELNPGHKKAFETTIPTPNKYVKKGGKHRRTRKNRQNRQRLRKSRRMI
jgi:hypothetical protein